MPLAIVPAGAVANGIIDFLGPGPWSAGLSAYDVATTLVWPLVLFLLMPRGKSAAVKA